ncbi:HNH endonuclease [Ornithinimicrobium murale]|uniref:HNH endonuclease n=1 Tax=Ornithinimicrobium murale TaxID=1050153 RepID=UPI000E0CF9E9|nr:HNH endonuclease signature motif containing protein [Ornithinimicrobium murale]
MLDIKNLGDYLLTPAALNTVALIVAAWILLLATSAFLARRREGLRDPQRMYSAQQRRLLFELCGGRCEQKSMFWFRCRQEASHADHVYPHSRGGSTSMENGQGLCAFHNLSKGGRVPSRLYRARLARRRVAYYPPGVPRKVQPRRPAATVY